MEPSAVVRGLVDRLPEPRDFKSRLHNPGVAARLGIALGISFTLCMLTGLVSHYFQQPPTWLLWPSRPVNLYRLNQGVHVLSGLASIPLLLAKLWTVYPKLFERPLLASVGKGLEKAFILVLVGGAAFQLVSGSFNVAVTYPWGFSFLPVHFAMAFVVYGALLIHVGHEYAKVRQQLKIPLVDDVKTGGLTRRGFLGVAAGASGLLVLGTAGQTVPLPEPLARWLSPFATHLPRVGPQGVPVRKSAISAGVVGTAIDPAYRLTVSGAVGEVLELSLDDLRALPQTTVDLPITCVEGWSSTGTWTGVALRDLLVAAGAGPDSSVRVVSLQQSGVYSTSAVDRPHVQDAKTLLALELNGEPLHIDHGFPCRLIAPNRPGVLQTKWLTRVEVSA